MASTVQTPVYTHPPPSFSRNEHSSSMNSSFAQSALHSFDSSQSVALTPSATPPPRATPQATSQPQMSFNMSGSSTMNGLVPKGGSFGGYGEVNGHSQPVAYYGHDAKHRIYTVSGIECHAGYMMNLCHTGCLCQYLSVRDGSQRHSCHEKAV
jgi:hypothetical protein